MNKKFLTVLLLLSFFVPLVAEINMLSPVEGEWANRQMLVIDNNADGDFFYSIDGEDPETFGFAYDGPVLLDVTGEVKLKVTHLSRDGKKENQSVSFTVRPDDASKTNYKNFVQTFYDAGIINYSAGSELVIPKELSFYLGLPSENYMAARTLRLSESSVLSRYIPCTVLDGARSLKYRFIIKTFPQTAGAHVRSDVPFEITDWETITFTDINLIYKIDSEYWGLPTKPVKIDRSVSHMISWQNLEYEPSNPVEFFVLPPRPKIEKEETPEGSFSYSVLIERSYSLSIQNQNDGSYSELFQTVGVDAFYGDFAEGKLTIGVFANSVYQGSFDIDYNIDKRPAQLPVVKSNAQGFCSRNPVDVKISVPRGSELYVALSEPLTLEPKEVNYSADDRIFKSVSTGEYKKVKGENFAIRWGQNGIKPVYYKVSAYSKRDDNFSNSVEFAVIIDQSNYYFDSLADSAVADGTLTNPFTDFSQIEMLLKNQRAVKLCVKGELQINERFNISSNFEIINGGNAKINFGPNGSLEFKGATFEISDCHISNVCDSTVESIVPFIKLENSVLTMKNCVIDAQFSKNGTVIDSYNSILNISDTIASSSAVTYVSFISAVKSRMTINSCSLSSNAETCVVISADNGNINAKRNEFLINGGSGRIAELFSVKALFVENTFKARLSDSSNKNQPIYFDKATKLTDSKNERSGF